MPQLTRRAALAAGATLLTFGARAQGGATPAGFEGQVFTLERGGVRLHTYRAPAAGALVTSHIIETAAGPVLVDGQFQPGPAREVGRVLQAGGRPVARTFLTHAHPDHWFGLHHLGRPQIHAGPVTAGFLRANGASVVTERRADSSAPEVAGTVVEGEETIGGVTFRHRLIADTEAPEMLVIEVPALRAVIVGDLLYNRVHAVVSRSLERWIAVLRDLERSPEGTTILGGHGEPATIADVPLAIRYLEAVRPMIAERRPSEAIVAEMSRAFPDHRLPPLLGLGLSRIMAS